jgi:hypothetical protein
MLAWGIAPVSDCVFRNQALKARFSQVDIFSTASELVLDANRAQNLPAQSCFAPNGSHLIDPVVPGILLWSRCVITRQEMGN